MRTLLASALLSLGFAASLACGGGQASSDVAKNPAGTSPSAGSTDTNAATPVDAGPTTTTTTTLGDAGDLQGARLTETHVVAATSASATPPSKGPHGHDPGRGPADIRAIVVAHREEARACYDAALKEHPGIEGDLVIQFTIDPKGTVTQVSEDTSRSQITEPSVVSCVGSIVKKIQFASSPGGFETKAFYPFNFHPRHGNQAPADGQ